MVGAIWTFMICVSILFSLCNGTVSEVSSAALEGAAAAVRLCIAIGGPICLWCGVMELMRECGLADKLSHLLRPILGKLFRKSASNESIMQPLSANVAANLLGLGNAATPMGVKTACEMAKVGIPGTASDDLCRLVVLNTASVQLLPITSAALLASAGAANAFDILPAVWISSCVSVAVGLVAQSAMCKLC